jgi:uncharacterized protein (TIGR02147 family)
MESSSASRPQIYRYSDYRVFIADMYLYRKNLNPKFSYHFIARRLETSRGYLKNIIDGRRHITLERIYPLAQVLGLDVVETDFFMLLVLEGVTDEANFKERLRRGIARMVSSVDLFRHGFDDLQNGMYHI